MKRLLICMMLCLVAVIPVFSQRQLSGKEKKTVVDSLEQAVIEWETVGLTGKIRNDRLPLRPTLKIYMVRGKELFVSLRAPLLGELGRIEIAGDDVLIVNKHNRTYVNGSLSSLSNEYPGLLQDLQNLLLGQTVLFGYGVPSGKIAGDMDLSVTDDGALILRPTRRMAVADYGYVISEDYLPALLMVNVGEDNGAEIAYSFSDSGRYMMEILYQGDRKSFSVDIEFEAPDYSPRRMDRLKLDDKYREVTVKEFISGLTR